MDKVTFSEKKHAVSTIIQELYDETIRLEEVHQQYKCENNLKLRENITTIRNQESEIKEKNNKISELESDISKKKIQLNDYEKMIRDLEDKINEILHENIFGASVVITKSPVLDG